MLVPKKLGFVLSALLIAMLTLPVLGQANPGGGGDNGNGNNNNGNNNGNGNGNNGGGGGGGGGFGGRRDPAQFQQQMMDRLKTQLGASDDEFAAIQPKIQAVMTIQRDVITRPRMFGRGGPGGGGRGGFGGGFGGPTTQPSAVQTALTDLQTTLDDQNASPDDIKTKLDTLRQAKSKARQDLIVAQQDLKSILTQRQEAVMVLDGYLD